MIEAVVALASGATEEEAPPELRLHAMCQRYHTLPDAGPLLEQDAGLLGRMTILSNVYEAVSHYRSLHGEEIHRLSAEDGRVLVWLEEIGIPV